MNRRRLKKGKLIKDRFLVRLAVKEYMDGELSSKDAIWAIWAVMFSEKPGKAAMAWAKGDLERLENERKDKCATL